MGRFLFVFSSLGVNRGGLTKSVIKRANYLAENGCQVTIATYLFQDNYHEVVAKLRNMGELSENVEVLNFFDAKIYQKRKNKYLKKVQSLIMSLRDRGGYFVRRNACSYRFYRKGKYEKYQEFNRYGRLLFEDYMGDGRHRKRRVSYDTSLRKRKIVEYDVVSNLPRVEKYFDNLGRCRIYSWVSSDGGRGRTVHFCGRRAVQYKSLRDFQREWVYELAKEYDVIVSDSRKVDDLVRGVKYEKLKKIAVLHNNHFKDPSCSEKGVKAGYHKLFSDDEFDNYVFLTEGQRSDVASNYEIFGKTLVIPHAIEVSAEDLPISRKKRNEFVMLARYENQKRIDHAIRAFALVLKANSEATLEVYGEGEKKNELEELISSLGVADNVFLRGYARSPKNILHEAGCLILSSEYEGFGLAVGESLACGTPVVAYECKYGPSDMIEDGVNGYLVESGNVDALSIKIKKILELPFDDFAAMSENAKISMSSFSKEKFVNSWKRLVY
ncbi:putative poly(glycerol-phosphate) alpha-glucosyltransferase [Halomonas sp. THAF12]|uniref:glycosyltransferase n=1 Tax=Halomonas sp. THAF12 TaxID=2587849 RepID=UPI001268A00D|nr:glycosyltransferase [Halomonas sp. THAF12]QFT85203.1 putative poly(glycerol-phosphate) alpha-glucosyltransferase [Halomonas sp. THAF12]